MAATHVRYGYRRLTVLLRREGWKISAKRVYRLYDEENLKVRSTERKKIARRQRVPQARALGPPPQYEPRYREAGPREHVSGTPKRCGASREEKRIHLRTAESGDYLTFRVRGRNTQEVFCIAFFVEPSQVSVDGAAVRVA